MTDMNIFDRKRLVSLDLFRGLTMFLLVAEAALVYEAFLKATSEGSFFYTIFIQFTHHPWHGLRFWDLIQPFFMFIVGVAMPCSLKKRMAITHDRGKMTRHILKRCLLLFLFGTGLHCVYAGKLVFELWNVLTQLSFTILITYVLLNSAWKVQLGISMGLLILTEILYRAYNLSTPYEHGINFGNYVDQCLMGKINDGGWVAINCVPTTAHTLWGVICGNILLSLAVDEKQKIILLLSAGAIGLTLGYGLDLTGLTPIIKRISTSSFVLVSGGWAIVALTFCYWLVDVKNKTILTYPFVMMGMNSIFIYLFAEILGHRWLYGFIHIFSAGVLNSVGVADPFIAITDALLTLGAMWYLCHFLYKSKIFFKI